MCIHPDGPVLPLSEFYTRVEMKDGLDYLCKKCKRVQVDNPEKECRGHLHEKLVVDKLLGMGIPTVTGRGYPAFKHIDVVAWGCVKIEVKSSKQSLTNLGQEQWIFKFDWQRRHGLRSDLVVLIPLTEDENVISYHVFPSSRDVFYKDGRVKSGVGYSPYASHRKAARGEQLTPALVAQHQDAWHLIEEKRLEIHEQLKAGAIL